jgi:hypothetical protein
MNFSKRSQAAKKGWTTRRNPYVTVKLEHGILLSIRRDVYKGGMK